MTTVFNFSSEFLNNPDNISSIPGMLLLENEKNRLLVIAAFGDTRSALKQVAKTYFDGPAEEAIQQFHQIKSKHIDLAKTLLTSGFDHFMEQVSDLFTEIEWLMHDRPVRRFEYYHDQIVCLGELADSCIISHYLKQSGLDNTWADIRDLIRTDHHFMHAKIDADASRLLIEKTCSKKLTAHPPSIWITQANIGATEDNESTSFEIEPEQDIAAFMAKELNAVLIQNN